MPLLLILSIVFIFGAVIGSFLNVLILRLPHKETTRGRSYCPHCKHQLQVLDLVPILSYIYLLGRCRYCRKSISSRYIFIEVLTGLLFVISWLVIAPFDLLGYALVVRAWFILAVLVVVFVIDAEHYLILDRVLIPATTILLVGNVIVDVLSGPGWISFHGLAIGGAVSGVVAGLLFFGLWFVSKGRWMGLGDAKLMLFLGLAAGWPHFWIVLLLAFFLGTIAAIPLLISGKKTMQSALPFGTFLAVGCALVLLFGQALLDWYLGLIGLR